MTEIHVLEDEGALARAAAERVAVTVESAIHAWGRCDWALAGGRTPERLYRTLAADPWRARLDWSRIRLLFGDERAVPPDHPDSTYRTVRESLLDPAGVPPEAVHRMRGEEADLEAAAAEYERALAGPLDLLLLGLGEDGHTASIFPGSALVLERVRRVVPVLDSPKPPARRLSITPRVIHEARQVVMLASGESKADAVWRALETDEDARTVPARLARHGAWYLDRAAARKLSRRETPITGGD